jgi:hypothetical protein
MASRLHGGGGGSQRQDPHGTCLKYDGRPHPQTRTSRTSGEWSDDDYDVLEDGVNKLGLEGIVSKRKGSLPLRPISRLA